MERSPAMYDRPHKRHFAGAPAAAPILAGDRVVVGCALRGEEAEMQFVIFNTVAKAYYVGVSAQAGAEFTETKRWAMHFETRGDAIDWLAKYFPTLTRDIAVIAVIEESGFVPAVGQDKTTLRDWIFGLGAEEVLRQVHAYCLDKRDEALKDGENAQVKYSGLVASEIFHCLNQISSRDGRGPISRDQRGELVTPAKKGG